jgi:hypothetical protein
VSGDDFSGSNLTEKILGDGIPFCCCFTGVFEGVPEIRVFFDGNLLVDLW